MKINRGRKPPSSDGSGMWEFPVAAGVMLKAVTEDGLTKLIFEFRLRNGIAVGDIERDVEKYYCDRWPNACNEEPSDRTPGGARAPHHEKLLDRITRWATIIARAMPRGGYQLAEKEVAEQRASACHGCPNNKSWRGGCAGCTQSISSILVALRQMRKTSHDGNLLGCTEFGWDNITAVWLPAPEVTEEQSARLPTRCWLKRK